MLFFHPNKQLALEGTFASDDEEDDHFYDENGYELTEDDFNARYAELYERLYDSEWKEYDLIQDGGDKDESDSWF